MQVQDLLHHQEIRRLTRLTEDLRHSRTPDQTLRAFWLGFADGDELLASLMVSTRGLGPDQYRVVRMHLADDPRDGADGAVGGRLGQVCRGGVVPTILGRAQPELIQDVDWSRDPYFRKSLRGYSSVIAVPFSGDRLPMDWVLLLRKSPGRFTVPDVVNAVERVALGGALLENQMLAADLERAHERIDHEARQVGELQRSLLPASAPNIAGLSIATSYQPSGRAGGDLYDFFPLDECTNRSCVTPSRWCVFVGDASGHGLAAAVVMAIVQAVLRAHPARIDGPAALLAHANRQLCGKGIGGFFTAFLGVYERKTRTLTYANAGHPPPLLKRSEDGSVVALDEVASFPLGIDDTETFEEASVRLDVGDDVLLYTDGITEARDATGEMLGQERLARMFGDHPDTPADLVERLRAAVREHEHGEPAPDDQTLVAARVL